MERRRLFACNLLVFSALAAGCAVRSAKVEPAYGISSDKTYMDLQPGWRLRVLTPLLKSGGFRLNSLLASEANKTVEIKAGEDFLGYELAYYAVEQRSIRLLSVEDVINEKHVSKSQPKLRLFERPADARFTRLIFLTRVSTSDHDMAVLTAKRYEDLASWTAKLKSSPEACDPTPYCSWIPSGIAVTSERPTATGEWIPSDSSPNGPRNSNSPRSFPSQLPRAPDTAP